MAAITGNKKKGWSARMRAVEVAAGITTTKDDRKAATVRLAAAETVASITTDFHLGMMTRLKNLEDHVW